MTDTIEHISPDELQRQFDQERDPAARYRLGLSLAEARSNQGKRDQAIGILNLVKSLAQSDHDEAVALIRLADVCNKKSDYEGAVGNLEEAVVKLSSQPDSLELLDVYLQIATIYWRQGYLERARSFLDGARLVMSLRRSADGPEHNRAGAKLLHVQAVIDGATGNQESAIKNYHEEIDLLESLNDTAKLGTVYNNLSGLLKARGQLAKALEYQLKAIDIAEKAGDPLSVAISCNNLGEIYFELGYQDKALPYYRLYMEMNKNIANRMGEAFGNVGLGRICQSRSEYEKAEKHFRAALEIAREVKSKGKEVSVLSELADLYCDWNRPQAAATALDEAIQICIEIQLFNTQRHQVLNARILYLEALKLKGESRTGRLAKARAILEDIVNHPITVEDEEAVSAADLEMECHVLLAGILHEQGQAATAVEYIDKAIGLANVFAEQFPEDIKTTYLSRKKIRDMRELKKELAKS
ncbi:MAG: tetratricopeptide repeat protein [Candidatus Edwardsbacteria bacterium]|nr:tetratricopeptide repeat protein [Candidatus Edwardsbacteria bacterium]